MKSVVYMKVSKDKYELPEAVAGSAAELARMVGVQENTIFIAIQRQRRYGWKGQYVRVEIGDEE